MFFEEYFNEIGDGLHDIDYSSLHNAAELIAVASNNGKKIIFAGNGGSASIASHLVVDAINAANIKAMSFNDPSTITCFANDYGYENWVEKALSCYAEKEDVLMLISSSGQSKNMLVAAEKALNMGLKLITLTGFSADNPLREFGHINLWIDSKKYNTIEMVHHIWALAIIDRIIELKSEG